MKFLIALSVLASSTAFANFDMGDRIKCYEPAQQDERGDLAYVLQEKNEYLYVTYPKELKGVLSLNQEGCLSQQRMNGETDSMRPHLEFCEAQGQSINGLVPIDVSYGREDETVYCEREILDWFETTPVLN